MATNDYNMAISPLFKHQGVQDPSITKNDPQVGKLSRYQVVVNMDKRGEEGLAGNTNYALGVYSEKVSLLDRIINYFTGFLTKEKNDAMIDFIRTGSVKTIGTVEGERPKFDETDPHLLDARLYIFKALMSGETGATIEQQREAIRELEGFLRMNDGQKGNYREKVSQYIKDNNITHDLLAKELNQFVAVASSDPEADPFYEVDLTS